MLGNMDEETLLVKQVLTSSLHINIFRKMTMTSTISMLLKKQTRDPFSATQS